MRRWLPRSLWLAAWSFWLWLGFGLYRELPRDLGPAIAILPLDEDEQFNDFLGECNEAVSIFRASGGLPPEVRVRDIGTGALLRRMEGPSVRGFWRYTICGHDSLLLSEARPSASGRPASEKPSVLDLRTGLWTDLAVEHEDRFVLHWTKPWALLCWRRDGAGHVKVVDLKTGAILMNYHNGVQSGGSSPLTHPLVSGQPLFVGESHVAIPIQQCLDGKNTFEDRLEIWPVSGAGTVKVLRDVRAGDGMVSSVTGRLAWTDDGDWPDGINVLDVNTGQFVVRHSNGRKQKGTKKTEGTGVVLSDDGKAIYHMDFKTLFAAESGRILWRLRAVEEGWRFIKFESYVTFEPATSLSVTEKWLVQLGSDHEFDSRAVRDFGTGRLRYRYWCSERTTETFNHNNTLVYIDEDNSIRRWPPRANFPLLALCQTILALPLVLLWAALRWRRKRRLAN